MTSLPTQAWLPAYRHVVGGAGRAWDVPDVGCGARAGEHVGRVGGERHRGIGAEVRRGDRHQVGMVHERVVEALLEVAPALPGVRLVRAGVVEQPAAADHPRGEAPPVTPNGMGSTTWPRPATATLTSQVLRGLHHLVGQDACDRGRARERLQHGQAQRGSPAGRTGVRALWKTTWTSARVPPGPGEREGGSGARPTGSGVGLTDEGSDRGAGRSRLLGQTVGLAEPTGPSGPGVT